MGHSLGGIVAMVYAARYPDHPAKLILSSTSTKPVVGERSFAVFERAILGRQMEALTQLVVKMDTSLRGREASECAHSRKRINFVRSVNLRKPSGRD